MRIVTRHLLLLSFFASTKLYSQTTDSIVKAKQLNLMYTGGRPKYSKVSLKLYSDSTYEYSNWYHFGQTENDIGKYSITDSTIVMYSKGFLTSKQNGLITTKYIFKGQQYRIQNNLLQLFTKKESKKDKTGFYKLYFTLHKVG
jgi:hypothetical protein